MTHQLFRPMHPNALPKNSLSTRVASALARPWQTSYVSPTLRTIDALVYALRGYDVYWTDVSFDEKKERRNPSSLCYRIFKRGSGERYPSHGVEVSSIFPGWAHHFECEARNIAWRIAARIGLLRLLNTWTRSP